MTIGAKDKNIEPTRTGTNDTNEPRDESIKLKD